MAEMYSFDWAIAGLGVLFVVGLIVALYIVGNIMKEK